MNDERDEYIMTIPSIQNIFSIFKGNFTSKFPGVETDPGFCNLSNDDRIHWINNIYPLKDKIILECGPLELAHSYMMHNMGALEITSIEANTYCYLKCLCVKDIFNLNRVKLLLGDCNKFIKNEHILNKYYDFVLCSGILYHLENPVDMIKNISKITDKIFIWTHIYSSESKTQHVQTLDNSEFNYDGEIYKGAKQYYKDGGNTKQNKLYCGGSLKFSFWLTKDSLYKALNKYGFNNIIINEKLSNLNHTNGACISIFCQKS